MSPGEERVWEAAYGAAFALDFTTRTDRNSIMSAIDAFAVADLAVGALRHMRTRENQRIGHSLPILDR